MLERQPIQTAVFGGTGRVEQGRVAFPQRDNPILIVKRQQFPIAPYTALIERAVARSPLSPDLFPGCGIRATAEPNFQQRPALGTVVDGLGNLKTRAAFLLEARQLG